MAKIGKILDTTCERIYARYAADADAEREYLGASAIGGECTGRFGTASGGRTEPRKIESRIRRLFDTGKREEARIVDDLMAGGVSVFGRQIGFSALGGHFRGHVDAIAIGLPEAPKTPHVLEIKTHNDGSFTSCCARASKIQAGALRASAGLYAALRLQSCIVRRSEQERR